MTSGGVHLTGMNLVAGEHVDFRQVVVRVRFPDGKPMKSALIRITGAPVREGEPPWRKEEWLLETDNVQLLAPANRKLRIEVQDYYGRKLNGSYASTHEPGTSTITQEFVVKP